MNWRSETNCRIIIADQILHSSHCSAFGSTMTSKTSNRPWQSGGGQKENLGNPVQRSGRTNFLQGMPPGGFVDAFGVPRGTTLALPDRKRQQAGWGNYAGQKGPRLRCLRGGPATPRASGSTVGTATPASPSGDRCWAASAAARHPTRPQSRNVPEVYSSAPRK